MDREACLRLDQEDPLAPFRDRFDLPAGVVYLDGNSLGALPRATAGRVREVVEREWGEGLVRSWEGAAWIDAPTRVGDKLARLVGAGPGEVIACDSTSVNVYKLLSAALQARPGRRVLLTETSNFPTDMYVAEGLAARLGGGIELRRLPRAQLRDGLDESVAALFLTHVDYASGMVLDMRELTAAAHAHGALAIWDLSHSAGAVAVDLRGCGVDLAVGCGYKFLNGGPGAPAYLFVSRHLQDQVETPITGWMGHARTFDFLPDYEPGPGVARFLAGTPPVLGLTALEVAVDMWLEADLAAVHAKARRLTALFIDLVDSMPARFGLSVSSPREDSLRGAQVSLRHDHGYTLKQALVARGVIGDFRPPDTVRFGFAPLYTRYVDVWDAAAAVAELLETGDWDRPEFRVPVRVT